MTDVLDQLTGNTAFSYEEAFSRHQGLLTRAEQEKLRNSRVAIIGMGGVGGIHLVTLARLGIGKFTIADPDTFELANFNRQYGANLRTLGRPKVEVMAEEARAINPELEIQIFQEPITPRNEAKFLQGADLFVDGIDFFSIAMRRRLFRLAAMNGIYSITAGPMGFSTAWLVFDPRGMTFDQYFDLSDDQSEIAQLIAYAVGLAPSHLHLNYLDLGAVSVTGRSGPSSGLACQLCAGVTAAESLKLLLGKPGIRPVPCYCQFDPYRGALKQGRLWLGNRNPMQRIKRWWLARRMAPMLPSSTTTSLAGAVAG